MHVDGQRRNILRTNAPKQPTAGGTLNLSLRPSTLDLIVSHAAGHPASAVSCSADYSSAIASALSWSVTVQLCPVSSPGVKSAP